MPLPPYGVSHATLTSISIAVYRARVLEILWQKKDVHNITQVRVIKFGRDVQNN